MNGVAGAEVGGLVHLSHFAPAVPPPAKEPSPSRSHHPPGSIDASPGPLPRALLAAAPVENGRQHKAPLTLETQNLSRPAPPRTTSSPSPASGTGHSISPAIPSVSRRPSWLSNFSSKFSSSSPSSNPDVHTAATHSLSLSASSSPPSSTTTTTAANSTAAAASLPSFSSLSSSPSSLSSSPADKDASSPSPSSKAPPGFLIATLRRLSSTGSTAREAFGRRGSSQAAAAAAPCERVVLNRDRARERGVIPELDGSKLRKVSFCVDVELAPYSEDADARKEARRKRREAKDRDRKDREQRQLGLLNEDGTPLAAAAAPAVADAAVSNCDGASSDARPPAPPGLQPPSSSSSPSPSPSPRQLQQQQQQEGDNSRGSDAAAAEAKSGNGSREGASEASPPSPTLPNGDAAAAAATAAEKPKPRRRIHPKPTTDPMKIYTQCCQLRETQVLPEIEAALLKENCPAVLRCMDLTGYKFQPCDAVTFSDFLALVPIKGLILEDCDLTDEAVRMILSALSAVKPILPPPASGAAAAAAAAGQETQHQTDAVAEEKPPPPHHHRGVIERLSFKRNPKIGRDGWRYISCFVHMSHSLKALDLSRIALPRPLRVYAPSPAPAPAPHQSIVAKFSPQTESSPAASDVTSLFSKALAERLCGRGLDELVMGHCGLTTDQLRCVIEGVQKGGTRRLGLQGNALTDDGLAMVGRWIKGSGICEALDLSHNNVQDEIDILSASIDELSPLCALSLSNCNLTPTSLSSLLPALGALSHFRWLDLSNNPLLFSSQPDSLQLLRRFLPRMHTLRKIDLSNTSMTSDHAIALCEVLPDVKQLAFFKMVQNPLVQSGHSDMTEEGSVEEGAALYTALVAAVKVSKTLVRVDVDQPGPSAGDVIHKLSKRLLAYCLQNMEAGPAAEDWSVNTAAVSRDRQLPALLHTPPTPTTSAPAPSPPSPPASPPPLPAAAPPASPASVAAAEANDVATATTTTVQDLDDEEQADYEYGENGEENFVVGGTGVVKALGVCLGNKPPSIRATALATFPALQRSETASSAGSSGDDDEAGQGQEKANEMSKALLTRARNIKARIQPALSRGYSSGDMEEAHHRKLLFLDDTLRHVIQRFEEEYPECREPLPTISESAPAPAPHPITTALGQEHLEDDQDSPCTPAAVATSATGVSTTTPTTTTHISKPTSRPGSEVSLHSKYLQNEEGQMHKLGHYMRHEIFADDVDSPPSSSSQGKEAVVGEGSGGGGDDKDDMEMAAAAVKKAHRASILQQVEALDGAELKRRIMEEEGGVAEYISRIEGGASRLGGGNGDVSM